MLYVVPGIYSAMYCVLVSVLYVQEYKCVEVTPETSNWHIVQNNLKSNVVLSIGLQT